MDDPDDITPVMRDLTDLQRRFVWAMAMTPGIAHWRAAEIAGYQGGQDVTKVSACRLMQQDKILRAIHDLSGKRMGAAALQAADFLVAVFADTAAPLKERIKAAESVLDRVGLGSEQNINVNHNHTDNTGKAMMERIRELADRCKDDLKAMGIDPQRLVASATGSVSRETLTQPVVIEGESHGVAGNGGAAHEDTARLERLDRSRAD